MKHVVIRNGKKVMVDLPDVVVEERNPFKKAWTRTKNIFKRKKKGE